MVKKLAISDLEVIKLQNLQSKIDDLQ